MKEGELFAVLHLNTTWPPSATGIVMSQTVEDTRVELAVDPACRFQLTVAPSSEAPRCVIYQPIRFIGLPRFLLNVAWSPDILQLRVNGVTLIPDDGPKTPVIDVPSNLNKEASLENALIPPIDSSKTQDRTDLFFLETVKDIQSKVNEGTWYSLIKAAGLLRLLLIDDTPLLHKVNRKHQYRVLFKVADYRTPPPVMPKYHWNNLDISGFPNAKTIEIDLQTLLNAPCLTSNNIIASVKDLIKVCANAKGGVHLGKARTFNEQALLDWDEATEYFGREPSAIVIKGMCRIVLNGIRPLVDAMTSSA